MAQAVESVLLLRDCQLQGWEEHQWEAGTFHTEWINDAQTLYLTPVNGLQMTRAVALLIDAARCAMAYTVMAVHIASIVMAYIAMAYIVLPCPRPLPWLSRLGEDYRHVYIVSYTACMYFAQLRARTLEPTHMRLL